MEGELGIDARLTRQLEQTSQLGKVVIGQMPQKGLRFLLNGWIHLAQQIEPCLGNLRPNHAAVLSVAMLPDQLEGF